jgi:3-hydroxy-3-methylglutaryl CoA synthase
MAARKKKRSPATGFDMQRAVVAHTEASQKAHAWTERSKALRNAGLPTAADRAEVKAKHWLSKMEALEPLAASGKPEGR